LHCTTPNSSLIYTKNTFYIMNYLYGIDYIRKKILIGICSTVSRWNANNIWKYTAVAIFCKLSGLFNARGMMGGMIGWWGGPGFMSGWFFPLPLIAGVLVLVGAIMLNARPQETITWNNRCDIFRHRLYRNGVFDTWRHPWNYWRRHFVKQVIFMEVEL
jgi:hypothetical protein